MHCRDGGTVFHIFEIKQQRQPTAVSLTASGDVNSQNIPGEEESKRERLEDGAAHRSVCPFEPVTPKASERNKIKILLRSDIVCAII